MSNSEDEILKLLGKLDKDRVTREKKLAKQLLQIYEDCRKELYIKFLEAQAGKDTLKVEQLAGTIQEIERQIKYYTNLAANARKKAIDEAYLTGQEFSVDILSAGGIDVSVIAGIGKINRAMIEALIGDVPQLAGKVQQDVLFRIRDELTRGAVLGESIPKIAKRVFATGITQEGLKKPFQTLRTRCEVIARTEIIKASDAGYEDMATKAQESIGEEIYDAWITAGDERVDSECRAIANGTNPRFKSISGHLGVYERGKGPRPVISTHPRCRCRRIPYLLSWAENGEINIEDLKGREKIVKIKGSSLPRTTIPNAVYDLHGEGGIIKKRRYYDEQGKAILDIDATDHGNPKRHPVVPHAHDWEDGKSGKWRDLTEQEKAKNQDLIQEKNK